eukprot:6191893-Pleurochrysis_carterae.AAC.1
MCRRLGSAASIASRPASRASTLTDAFPIQRSGLKQSFSTGVLPLSPSSTACLHWLPHDAWRQQLHRESVTHTSGMQAEGGSSVKAPRKTVTLAPLEPVRPRSTLPPTLASPRGHFLSINRESSSSVIRLSPLSAPRTGNNLQQSRSCPYFKTAAFCEGKPPLRRDCSRYLESSLGMRTF